MFLLYQSIHMQWLIRTTNNGINSKTIIIIIIILDLHARSEIRRRKHVQGSAWQVRQTLRNRHDAQSDVHLWRIRPREQRGTGSLDGVLWRMAQQPAERTWDCEKVPRRRNLYHSPWRRMGKRSTCPWINFQPQPLNPKQKKSFFS